MSVKIGSYLFEGSYQAPGDLRNRPGIFLVTEYLKGRHTILDIGESEEVRKAIETSNRRECWLKHSVKYELRVSVFYTPDLTTAQRVALAKQFRTKLKPPCGPVVKAKREVKPKKRQIVKRKVSVPKKRIKHRK
ncbi:MAG TPA: hypothetical protein VN963_09035 [bacterium]|nr:hypothetical protein [bacterium]